MKPPRAGSGLVAGKLAIAVGHAGRWRVLKDGESESVRLLHFGRAGQAAHDRRVEVAGELLDLLGLAGHVAGVEDDAAEAGVASLGEGLDGRGDVGGRMNGHVLARGDDEDVPGPAVADGHREAAADDVAEHVEDHDVGTKDVEGVLGPEGLEGGDDAAARAAHAWTGTTRLDAEDAALALDHHVIEPELGLVLRAQEREHGLDLRAAAQERGRVGLRVAADEHHPAAVLRKRERHVRSRGGLADAALAVDRKAGHRVPGKGLAVVVEENRVKRR